MNNKIVLGELIAAKEHLLFAVENLEKAQNSSTNGIDREVFRDQIHSALALEQRVDKYIGVIERSEVLS